MFVSFNISPILTVISSRTLLHKREVFFQNFLHNSSVDVVVAVHHPPYPGRHHVRGSLWNMTWNKLDLNIFFTVLGTTSAGVAAAADVHVGWAVRQHFAPVRWAQAQLPHGPGQCRSHLVPGPGPRPRSRFGTEFPFAPFNGNRIRFSWRPDGRKFLKPVFVSA